jgi:hypothetical protein
MSSQRQIEASRRNPKPKMWKSFTANHFAANWLRSGTPLRNAFNPIDSPPRRPVPIVTSFPSGGTTARCG